MHRIYQFDVCAFLVLCIIIFSMIVRKLLKGRTNKMFLALVIITLSCTVMDMLSVVPLKPLGGTSDGVRIAASYGYYIIHAMILPAYAIFIGLVSGTWYVHMRNNMRAKLLFCLPFAVNIILVLINPFTHWIMDFPDGQYHRGPHVWIIYAIAFIYMLNTFSYLVKHKETIDRSRMIAFTSIYPITLFATVIQFFMPSHLIEMFSLTTSLLILMFFVIKPEESFDAASGARNITAFKDDTKKLYFEGNTGSVLLIKVKNDNSLVTLYGLNAHQNVVRKAVSRMERVFKEQGSKGYLYSIYYLSYGLFAVLMTGEYDPDKLCSDIENALSKPIRLGDVGFSFENSLCFLDIPKDIRTHEELMSFVDTYDKSEVESGSIIYSNLGEKDKIRFKFDIDKYIERGFANDNFKVYFQPIYSIKQKRFISAEALLRLIDDEIGFISPALFIPAAEKSGAIYQIGDFVIDSVFRFIRDHDLEKLGLEYIEINISTMQCMKEDFVDNVKKKMREYGISNKSFNFEITETASDFLQDVLSRTVTKLHNAGIEFAIDDYGTGYSNLQRILQEPIKIIKLDKSLADDIANVRTRAVLMRTMQMITAIGAESVIEGVETKETAEWFIANRCDYIQGYYYARPMPENEFVDFIRSSNAAG
ncbi:MAG: EAL domain-containing protein [Ruminococcus sp.]|nr:EAL domain-containing protein [Ruminococcus sp.]